MTGYVKTLWKQLTAPAINATNLNKIEKGIYDVTEAVTGMEGSITTNANNIATNTADIATIAQENVDDHAKASMRLSAPVDVVGVDTAYALFPMDQVVSQNECVADAATHSITVNKAGNYYISRGIVAGFNGSEEMALMLHVNDVAYSTYPLTLQGRSNTKPVTMYWTDEVTLNTGDKVDLRVKNFDTGSVTFHVKRATLQVKKA